MGRIIANVSLCNALDSNMSICCDALVDTGASYLTLPLKWKSRLGKFEDEQEIECQTATQDTVKGIVVGPVKISIEGFRTIFNEVLFLDMHPEDGSYEPLIGYIILEQCGAAVDMIGHRLVPVKYMDLK